MTRLMSALPDTGAEVIELANSVAGSRFVAGLCMMGLDVERGTGIVPYET
jgi:hypothetical protein